MCLLVPYYCRHSNSVPVLILSLLLTVGERSIPTQLCYVQNVWTYFLVLGCTAQIMGGVLLFCLAILIPRPKSKIRECYSTQKGEMCI